MSGYEVPGLPTYIPQGTELFAADTGLPNGASPQVAAIALNQIAPAGNFRNLLEGADFTINPWQRGASITGISNTLTYTADRWFALGGASSSISVTRQTSPSGNLAGYRYALRFGRAAANADTAAISLGQNLGAVAGYKAQGKTLSLSMLMVAGANFSATGGVVTVSVIGGTGADESSANMMAGSWTGQVTLGTANFAVTNTAWGSAVPFTIAGISVPSTITELGLKISYTPVGTAGANDWIEIAMAQLEVGSTPSQFERRNTVMELEMCQRHFFAINEPANNVLVAIGGATAAANNQNFVLPTPVTMRAAPTVTISAGSWKVAAGAAAAAATGFAGGAAATQTPSAITVVSTLTQTAGQAAHLQGGGGAGYIWASAEL